MTPSPLPFEPSGSELSGLRRELAKSSLGDLEIGSMVSGTTLLSPDDLEERIPELAREATHKAYLESSAGPVGATIIRDGWICRVQNGKVVKRIKRAPEPVRVPDGVLTYRL